MSGIPAFAPVARRAALQRRGWADQNAKYIFLLPAVAYLLLLGIFPLIFSLYLVFSSWQAGSGITFVGLDNLRRISVDARFWDAVGRTITYVILAAGLKLAIGLLIALALQFATRGKAVLRLTLALPILLPRSPYRSRGRCSSTSTGGPVNYFLEAVGLPPATWLAGQKLALFSLVIVDVWQWTPVHRAGDAGCARVATD